MPDSTDTKDAPAEKAAPPAKPVRVESSANDAAPSGAEPAGKAQAASISVVRKVSARGKPVAGARPARKPAKLKPAAPTPAEVKAARRAARVAKAAQRPQPSEVIVPRTTVRELKEKIMATNNTDFAQPITEAVGDMQNRAKAAYEKGTEVAAELTEFTKGNVEAVVESSKIFASGAQSLGKTYVEEAKSAYETMTADVKELAAVRSPAELFQLQGKIMRRNFDSLVAATSKNGEAVIKLANDAVAPFTGRVNLAAEKLTKVA